MYYIYKNYPEAKFVMLATCKEYNTANYSNYMKNGMPVPTQGGGYTQKILMVDVDHPDHNNDEFDRRVGDDAAWKLWTHSEWHFTGNRLKNGKRAKRKGTRFPLTGRYGLDKHTLVAELPFFFGNKNTK